MSRLRQELDRGMVAIAMDAYDRLMADRSAEDWDQRLARLEALVGGPEALLRELANRAASARAIAPEEDPR